MIFRYPSYYDQFQCIADQCEDTCCAGWEIDIDDESYEFYMSVEGEFGERLRANIKEYESDEEDVYESHGFILKENKRCPFLNDCNLCDLYKELGEDALCYVCTYTPRNILEYGGERELAISASCPEAGRLIYGRKERTTFVERRISEELDFEEGQEEIFLAKQIRMARDRSIAVLQNRELGMEQRICNFLKYAEKVQECLNENEPEKIEGIALEPYLSETSVRMDEKLDTEQRHEYFLKRMRSVSGMDSISEKWENMLQLLQTYYVEPEDASIRYERDIQGYRQELRNQGREYEYEHLMVYYVFMCQSRCVDDYDFMGKAKLAVLSFLMIRDMDVARFRENNGNYDFADRVAVAGIYAKEVEHSEENLDYLAEEFLFEDAYETAVLSQCVQT